MKIPFDVKYRSQIESGEYKVETGDKKRVRIICWNRKVNDFPIVALAYDAQRDIEIFINASVLGEPKTDIASERLFIITPEPELSEFEHAFSLAIVDAPEPEEKEEWYQFLKEKATELLSIARKQLVEERYTSDPRKTDLYKLGRDEAFKEIEQDPESSYAFKRGVEYGKEEILKDLPRWRKFASNINDSLSEQRICKEIENSVLRIDVDGYCWVINRAELNKLPKED